MSQRSISPYEKYGAARPIESSALQTHIFIATDTISSIAQKYYGDWRLWRIIAEFNKLTDVRKIETGTVLIIPKRPKSEGGYEEV